MVFLWFSPQIVFLFPWFPLNLPDFRIYSRPTGRTKLLLSGTKSTFRINQMRKAMEMTSLAAVQVTLCSNNQKKYWKNLKDPKILERSDGKNGYIKYLYIYIDIYCIYICICIYVYTYCIYIYNHPQNSILGWFDVNMSRYSWRHPQATCVYWLLVPVKASTPVPAEKASGEIPFAMKKCETNG